MAAEVEIDAILIQQRLDTLAHIGPLALALIGLRVKRMMADDDLPFLLRRGQRLVQPVQLGPHILLARVGIFLGILAILVDQRWRVDKGQQGLLVLARLDHLRVIFGGGDPTAALLAVVEHRLRIATVLVVAVDGEPLEHQLRMAVDQLVVGHPKRVVDAGHALKMVRIAGGHHKLDVDLLGPLAHQLGDRLLLIIAITTQIAHQEKVLILLGQGRNPALHWNTASLGLFRLGCHLFFLVTSRGATTQKGGCHHRGEGTQIIPSVHSFIILFNYSP